MSSRRRLRIVCSSDEEEDEDEIQVVQPPPQQYDDIECETLNLQDVTLSSINSNPTNPSVSIQVEISDDDFIDADEDLFTSPQSPPPHAPPPPPPDQTSHSSGYSRTSSAGTSETSGSPISRILEDLGLRLRGEWLDACLRGFQTSIPGFSTFDATKQAKLCFEKFLNSDMNNCGAGLLPDNVHQMHLVDLPGPFVLQVDEIVNISQPLRERYKKASSGLKRCLKLSMTDGVQRVFGMEYQPIKDLDALSPAGLKVAICNVNVRHGLLMLVPEVFSVLGGLVEELDAARQRLVNEVNKPPRGKRTRTGVVPPLATRATRAAWPDENNNVSGASNIPVSQSANDQGTTPASVNGRVSSNSSVPVHRENVLNNPVYQNATPVHVDHQGTTLPSVNERVPSNSSFPVRRENVSNTPVYSNATPMQVDHQGTTRPSVNGRFSSSSSVPVHRENVSNNPVYQNATPIHVDQQGTTIPSVNGRMPSNSSVPVHRENVSNTPVYQNATPMQVDHQGTTTPSVNGRVSSNSSFPLHRENVSNTPVYQTATPIQVDQQDTTPPLSVNGRFSSNSTVPVGTEHIRHHPPRVEVEPLSTAQSSVQTHFPVPLPNQSVREDATCPIPSPVHISDDADTDELTAAAAENHSSYGRNTDSPFTYMASLSVKWAESKDKAFHVQGKIKCFVTGVKGFQFKKTTTYELQVYVDDGSLISEILIDHNVVQRKIGYSPEEVNTALSSSDPLRVRVMKDTMKQFQVFLVNFEGTMVVRINEACGFPVAIEMQQGCPLSDAWSLLTRLKSSNTDQPPQRPLFDPIDLSP